MAIRPLLGSVLIADDDEDDRMLIQKAFEEIGYSGELRFTVDGEETLSWLRRYVSALPDLVVLDLNMPKKNGYEVLTEMQADNTLASIPVVILSTSRLQTHTEGCTLAGTSSFLTKPSSFTELVRLVRHLCNSLPRVGPETKMLPDGL